MKQGEWQGYDFENPPEFSPFAPKWEYTIGEKQTDIDCGELSELLLRKEPELIEKYPAASDGSTNLGPNSVTSRFQYYNVMEWDEPICQSVRREIKQFHKQYTRSLFGQDHRVPRVRIRCWYNVMRKGQKISKHYHSAHGYTYLGGHLTVKCDKSDTVYVNPFQHDQGIFPLENKPGTITLFPNYIPHYTTVHKGKEPRITMAFDLTLLNNEVSLDTDTKELPIL
tara:strand:+ start:198 stop:872 length:675 start_codon:yes stop_codon:yes gene_type:complete